MIIMQYSLVADTFLELEKTSSRLETTEKLAGLFKQASPEEAAKIVYFLQGIVAPPYSGVDLGVAEKLCEQAITKASGGTQKELLSLYRKAGDLGEAARLLLQKKPQQTLAGRAELTASKVFDNLYRVATASGEGSQDKKIGLLSELLSNASPDEAKTIVRFVAGTARMGAGNSTIIDALSYVYSEKKEASKRIERAFNLTSDLGAIAEALARKGLGAVEGVKPEPFKPVRPALAERLNSAREIMDKLGKCKADGKYDGMRLQIHCDGEKVGIYSRKQEVITHMFPSVAREVASWKKKIIFEGEAVGYKGGAFLSFQETVKRRRKHGVEKKSGEIPVRVYAFELLYLGGDDYTLKPYSERRKTLEKAVEGGEMIRVARAFDCKDAEDLENFFNECVSRGLEGVIAKDLNAPYVAGARKFAWIKLKKSYSEALADTVDAAVVGYYYGKGKRTQFGLGGILAAVKAGNKYRTVAKIGTGFTEEQLAWFRKTLEKEKVQQKPSNVESELEPDEWVKPRLVVEVKADEITSSPVHTCARKGGEGLALRFPRLVRVREDKSVSEATNEKEVIQLYEKQRQST